MCLSFLILPFGKGISIFNFPLASLLFYFFHWNYLSFLKVLPSNKTSFNEILSLPIAISFKTSAGSGGHNSGIGEGPQEKFLTEIHINS